MPMDASTGINWNGRRLEAVILDLDGTLVNSLPDIAETLNLVLSEAGYQAFEFESIRKMVGGGVPKLLERALRAQEKELPAEPFQALVDRFLALYRPRAAKLSRLYPGALDLLKKLKETGIRIGLCTNKPTDISREILQDLAVAEYFGSVVGGEPDKPKKPDPAPLLQVLDELGVAPSGALMIGDSPADFEAARRAGVSVVLVTYGYSRTPVQELGCEQLIDGLGELFYIIPGLGPVAG